MNEDQLRTLMVHSLRGDADAYRELLATLVGDLRSYFRHRIALDADEIEKVGIHRGLKKLLARFANGKR